jgi:glycosyltransferase involved in cell wall biosynthesis
MTKTILEIAKGKHFDLIHIDKLYFGVYLKLFCNPHTKRTVTFHDIDSVKLRRLFKIESNIRTKALLFVNWLMVRNWESRIAERFDLCIALSSFDLQVLKSMNPRLNVAVIPNGVDIDAFKLLPLTNEQCIISFFGAMDYVPNIDGALYFYKHIFPLIRKQLPGVKFLLIGQNPAYELKKLSSDPNVIVTGFVEDVIPYYQQSSVVVVPLRAGGGTRLKILEAMAVGRPVVSTSLGAEGLDVADGENIMLANSPEDFANKTIELMTNLTLRQKLTASARRFVESCHSWRKIADDLGRVYQELCSER